MESFDSVLRSLDYQIEDCKEQLKNTSIDYKRKSDIDVQISNGEYSKTHIQEIRDKYFNARDKYNAFCESDKAVFDLYAGQAVSNCLVEFNVVTNNVFIAGYSAENVDNPSNNGIEITRRKLINSMRNDIGIY